MNRFHRGLRPVGASLLAEHPRVELLDFDLIDGSGPTPPRSAGPSTTNVSGPIATNLSTTSPADTTEPFATGATGPSAARPAGILAVHGFGGDKAQLRPIVEAVRPSGAPALLPTLRSHGDSPAPVWGYSPLDFTADIHRIADALPGPLDLIGYSYGALVAALSAVTWAGDRVRSLVLIDQSFEAHPDRFVADEWAEGSHLRWNYDFGHLPDLLEAMGVPVLMLFARDSDTVGPRERERLRARPGALFSCADIPGTHDGLLRHPAEIAGAVREFHARSAAGAGSLTGTGAGR